MMTFNYPSKRAWDDDDDDDDVDDDDDDDVNYPSKRAWDRHQLTWGCGLPDTEIKIQYKIPVFNKIYHLFTFNVKFPVFDTTI